MFAGNFAWNTFIEISSVGRIIVFAFVVHKY